MELLDVIPLHENNAAYSTDKIETSAAN